MRLVAAIVVFSATMTSGCAALRGDRDRSRDRDNDRPPEKRSADGAWWLEGNDKPASRTRERDDRASDRDRGREREKDDRPRDRDRVVDRSRNSDRDSVIAGEVVDGRENRRLRGKTYIVVKAVDESTTVTASSRGSVGFETDEDGYFFMPGLPPGKTFVLSAVREIDGRKIATEMQVKPPAGNIRLVLSDDKVSTLTPPLPPPPGMGPFEPRSTEPATIRPPTPPIGTDRGFDPAIPPPPEPGAAPVRRESIAGAESNLPPTAAIRPPPPPAPVPDPRPVSDPPMTRLPGNRAPNFVVSDLLGSDWEFRYAAGRLVLVDFWGTHCTPCMRSVPALKRLQSDYGQSGLEIVAIACEGNAPFAERAKAVDEVARKKELNYRVYLERENHTGEVQKAFAVQFVPTLVLLDRQGTILFRGGGTETDFARLEQVIREVLSKR